jgi:hypothetical protein
MTDILETPQTNQFTLLDSEPGKFAFYAWHNITIVIWLSQATGPAVLRLGKVLQSMVETHPKGISSVQIITDRAAVPTSEARKGFVDLMKQHAKQLACVAVVLLGGGFWASAMQAAVTGIRMITPHSFPPAHARQHSRSSEMVV